MIWKKMCKELGRGRVESVILQNYATENYNKMTIKYNKNNMFLKKYLRWFEANSKVKLNGSM